MSDDLRSRMDAALKQVVLPVLRQSGFTGSLPHLRRVRDGLLDLLTFQFDRHGGGFVIEIAQWRDETFTTSWGEVIPPRKLRAWDLHPDKRFRVQPRKGGGTDAWFRYDDGDVERAAREVLASLPDAERRWRSLTPAATA